MNVIDNFFEGITNLPMMPKVVQEVIQLLNDEDAEIREIVEKIERDPVISAKVLRLSNASCYGHSKKIQNIDDAISLIGLNSLRTLVIASGVTGAFTIVPGLDMKKFWRHSLVSASIARFIAKERRQETETAYIAALMHNIGQLPIHIVFPGAGTGIAEMCKGLSVLERSSVEHATIGIDHCQVGEQLARRWNFPEDIQSAIRYYTDPLNPKACSLAPVVYMAAHISFGLEMEAESKYIAETLNPDVISALQFHRIEWIDRIESFRDLVREAESFI
jgi:HD-like signal output (HDOD) protein